MTQRARCAGLAAVTAIVIGGGVATGAALAGPGGSATPAAAASVAAPASYAGEVRQVLPSVVLIRAPGGLGSGVALDRSGNIVTNAHVAEKATAFQVQTAGDPAPRTARLVGTHPSDDLAVIRVDDASGLQPATFGDSDQAQAGDVVLAVGNPFGLSGSVTEGIISAIGRAVAEPSAPGSAAAALPGAIQTSAPINPGNGGSALDGTPRGTGTVAVTSGGPADKAGLRPGDVIQAIGPDRTADATAMAQALAAARPGDQVTLTVTRGTQNLTVPVTLGELPGS
jgi:putative serine protease PepD